MVPSKPDCKLTVVIWDTGASFGFNSFSINFIDYVRADIHVKYVTKFNRFTGIGSTIQNLLI